MTHRSVSTVVSKRMAAITAAQAQTCITDDKNLPKVLYESENYLCVSKGHDIKINSDDRTEIKTVEHQLRHMYPGLVDDKCKHGFRFVHRLDYATSGVICLGLNKKAAHHLWKQFVARSVTKYYFALLRGHVKESMIFIDVATGDLEDQDWPGRRCTPNHPQCINPKDTKTLLICLEKGTYMNQPATKVLLKPLTGRTHQLRVHCDHIGHTIVGDYTYSLRADTDPDRMMLHSHRLITDTGLEMLNITSPDPFTPNLDTRWRPQDICCLYDQAVEFAEHFDCSKSSVKTVTLTVEDT